MNELPINISKVPEFLYHIVPKDVFLKYLDENRSYDPRNKMDFGKNSPFIHTTPSIEQMNSSLAYLRSLPQDEFYLVKIEVRKLGNPKITYAKFGERIYHHLWCELNNDSYTLSTVKKTRAGTIEILKNLNK